VPALYVPKELEINKPDNIDQGVECELVNELGTVSKEPGINLFVIQNFSLSHLLLLTRNIWTFDKQDVRADFIIVLSNGQIILLMTSSHQENENHFEQTKIFLKTINKSFNAKGKATILRNIIDTRSLQGYPTPEGANVFETIADFKTYLLAMNKIKPSSNFDSEYKLLKILAWLRGLISCIDTGQQNKFEYDEANLMPGAVSLMERHFETIVYHLNEKQSALVENAPKKCIIKGVAGSGKTIIMKFTILKLIQEGKEWAAFVPKHMMDEYSLFLFLNSQGRVSFNAIAAKVHDLSCPTKTIELIRNYVKNGNFNIFIDDAQQFYFLHHLFSDNLLLDLIEKSSSSYFWVLTDIYQFLINGPLLNKEFRLPTWMPTYELDRLLRNTTTIGKFAFRLREALFQRLYEKPKQTSQDTVKAEKKTFEVKKEACISLKIPKGASTSTKELKTAPTGKSPSEICQMHRKMGHQIPGNKIIIIKSQKSFDQRELPKFYQNGLSKALCYLERFLPFDRLPVTSAIIFSNKCIPIIARFKEESRSSKRSEFVHKNENVNIERGEKCEKGTGMPSTSVTKQKTYIAATHCSSSNKKSHL